MSECDPCDCFGTQAQRDICYQYHTDAVNNCDWEAEFDTYKSFLSNRNAEKQVGLGTNFNENLLKKIEKRHITYVADMLNNLQSAHAASAVIYENPETEKKMYDELRSFLDFYGFESEIELADRMHKRYEKNRKWNLIGKAISLKFNGF